MKRSSVIKMKAALCLLLAGLLTGCAAEPPRPDVRLENGKQILQRLDEGLWIDLQVDYPEGVVPKIYRADLPSFDDQVVGDFLAAVGDSPAEVLYDGISEGQHIFSLRTESGAEFYYSRSENDTNLPICSLTFDTPEGSVYSVFFHDDWPQRENSVIDNTYLYTEPKDFAFASCQQAKEQAEIILRSLGFSDLVLAETLYLDHEVMAAYLQTPEAVKALEQAGAQGLARSGCDAASDAYYFRFTFFRDGVPATEHILEAATSYVAPTEMTVLIDASGPVSVYVNAPWRFLDAEEVPSAMTPPDTVLQEVIEQELDTLTPFPRIIDGLWLEYLAVQAGDHWIRTPVWIATVLYEGTIQVSAMEYAGEHRVYLFDAISGDRIL